MKVAAVYDTNSRTNRITRKPAASTSISLSIHGVRAALERKVRANSRPKVAAAIVPTGGAYMFQRSWLGQRNCRPMPVSDTWNRAMPATKATYSR